MGTIVRFIRVMVRFCRMSVLLLVNTRMFDGMGAPTEEDSERDGFLSYSAECHAVGHGLFDGMKDWRVRPSDLPENDDVQAEPHYYKGAYVLGTLLQLGIAVGLGKVVF